MKANLDHRDPQRTGHSSPRIVSDVSRVTRSSVDMMPSKRMLDSPQSGRQIKNTNHNRIKCNNDEIGVSRNNGRSSGDYKEYIPDHQVQPKKDISVVHVSSPHKGTICHEGGTVQHRDPIPHSQGTSRRDRKAPNERTPTRTASCGGNALSRIAALRGGLPTHRPASRPKDVDKSIVQTTVTSRNGVDRGHSELTDVDPLAMTKSLDKENMESLTHRPVAEINKQNRPDDNDRFSNVQKSKLTLDNTNRDTSSPPQRSPQQKITPLRSREHVQHFEDLPAAVATREKIGVKNEFLVPENKEGNCRQTSENQASDNLGDRHSPTQRKPKMLLRGQGQKRLEQAHRQNRGCADTNSYEPQQPPKSAGRPSHDREPHQNLEVGNSLNDASGRDRTMAEEEAEWRRLKQAKLHPSLTDEGADDEGGGLGYTGANRPLQSGTRHVSKSEEEIPESFIPVPKQFLDLLSDTNSSTAAMAIRSHLLSVFSEPKDVAYLSTFTNKNKLQGTSCIEQAKKEDKQILETLDARRLDFMNSVFSTPNNFGGGSTNGKVTTGQMLEKRIAQFPCASSFVHHGSLLKVSRFEHIREILNSETPTR